jgi:hypothetical protein
VSTRVRPVKFWPSPIDGRMNGCQTVTQFPHHRTVVFSWTAEAVFCAAAGPGACTSHRFFLVLLFLAFSALESCWSRRELSSQR